MRESPVFTKTCRELEERTTLSEVEARGTVRLALKSAGLEAQSVTTAQVGVVLDRVLPNEFVLRGIGHAGTLCKAIRSALDGLNPMGPGGDTPDSIFERLGKS